MAIKIPMALVITVILLASDKIESVGSHKTFAMYAIVENPLSLSARLARKIYPRIPMFLLSYVDRAQSVVDTRTVS